MKSPSYLSSAHGTGRHSLSWQHSCGYQECATAAPLTSINAAASKQTSFGIIDPQSCPTLLQIKGNCQGNLLFLRCCIWYKHTKRENVRQHIWHEALVFSYA